VFDIKSTTNSKVWEDVINEVDLNGDGEVILYITE